MQCRSRIVTGFIVVIIAGCGSEGAAPRPDARADVPVADAPAAPSTGSLAAFCATDGPFERILARTYECLPSLSFLEKFRPTADDLARLCAARYQPFVDDGTLSFAGGAAWDTCLGYAASLTCTDVALGSLGPCEQALVGTLAMGAHCRIDEHCLGAAWCDNTGTGCPVCAPLRADGMSCFDSDSCESGNCGTGGCRGWSGVDEPCGESYDCVGNLTCVGGHCTAPLVYGDGTPCGTNGACGADSGGLYCDAGTCRARKHVGESCTFNSCDWYRYERCDVGGSDTCVAPVIGGEGSPCDEFEGQACATGLLCSTTLTSGVCFRPRADGEACSATDLAQGCAFGLRCVLGQCSAADQPVCLNP
ncbi:MAG: hypothetical protein K8W52_03345 [Deltaproteobacteria bacterium]|nr:hypothetical protein [Deltaproteobacteria bacterium]